MTTITLSSPVEFAGKTITEITFSREPNTGDLMAADNATGEMSKIVIMLASISEVPLQAFKKIGVKDFGRVLAGASEVLGELSLPAPAGE